MSLEELREWQPLLLRALWGIHFHRDGGAASAAAASGGIAAAGAADAATADAADAAASGPLPPRGAATKGMMQTSASLPALGRGGRGDFGGGAGGGGAGQRGGRRSSVDTPGGGHAKVRGLGQARRLGLRHPEALDTALFSPVLRTAPKPHPSTLARPYEKPISEHLLWRPM